MMERGRFTRMGVVNLYEYGNEVFVFEDGKLVIKGANGVGKSRALELTYPLLLEGNIAEYRVDTTGKQGRPFAWNLSLGDVYPRQVQFFPCSGKARVRQLRGHHATVLVDGERNYLKRLANDPIKGEVELF